jgi:hypothetical protein
VEATFDDPCEPPLPLDWPLLLDWPLPPPFPFPFPLPFPANTPVVANKLTVTLVTNATTSFALVPSIFIGDLQNSELPGNIHVADVATFSVQVANNFT